MIKERRRASQLNAAAAAASEMSQGKGGHLQHLGEDLSPSSFQPLDPNTNTSINRVFLRSPNHRYSNSDHYSF